MSSDQPPSPPQAADPKAFRNALGKFVTGVTIVTTTDETGAPAGVTASSFNSVSLDPPLVLWSLAKSARSLEAFTNSGHFCVHVLHRGQEALSNRFASKGADKFADLEWREGQCGSPVFEDFAALFECATTYQYDGGDHIIFVGEVKNYKQNDNPPLAFVGGAYAQARSNNPIGPTPPELLSDENALADDYFLFLLSRSFFQSTYPLRRKLREYGSSESEYFAMALLSLHGQSTTENLRGQLFHMGLQDDEDLLYGLLAKKLITYAPHTETELVTLTEKGRETFLDLLLLSKEMEEHYLSHFSENEAADMKHLLRRLNAATVSEIPAFRKPQK